MIAENLRILLDSLGWSYVDRGDWFNLSCPISYKFHLDGDDEHPSCGISVGDTISVMNCFACGTRSLFSVLYILYLDGKVDKSVLKEYVNLEFSNITPSTQVCSVPYNDVFNTPPRRYDYVPDFILHKLKRGNLIKSVISYLTFRKIDLSYSKDLYFYKNSIVFPIKDEAGRVKALHCRSITEKKFWFLSSTEFRLIGNWDKGYCWYGMDSVDWSMPVFLVEGEFDLLRLKTLGITNVLACCGSLSDAQIDYLTFKNPPLLYLGFDSDSRGQKYTQKIRKYFKNCIVIDWGRLGIKDAGELKDKKSLTNLIKGDVYGV